MVLLDIVLSLALIIVLFYMIICGMLYWLYKQNQAYNKGVDAWWIAPRWINDAWVPLHYDIQRYNITKKMDDYEF